MNLRPRLLFALAATMLAATLLTGCERQVAWPGLDTLESGALLGPPAPDPASPAQLVNAFDHAMDHRDLESYSELFTNDFQFLSAAVDSAGNAYRDHRLGREDELAFARHLFVTGIGVRPPAQSIVLRFDRSFFPGPDSRPGKTYPWHQEVRKNFEMTVVAGRQVHRLNGAVRFFIVRGDSADIPPDLVARGFTPDSSRWWIERWEDESLQSAPAPAAGGSTFQPAPSITWTQLKAMYLGLDSDPRLAATR